MNVNRTASIHARLLERAKRDGVDVNPLLARYALERWLYRLSISQVRGEFMLKGALLFDWWFDVPHRPTRDADFLGFGPADAQGLARTVQTVCRIRAVSKLMTTLRASLECAAVLLSPHQRGMASRAALGVPGGALQMCRGQKAVRSAYPCACSSQVFSRLRPRFFAHFGCSARVPFLTLRMRRVALYPRCTLPELRRQRE